MSVQEGKGKNAHYRGILHATRLIIKEEGLLALYKGWLPSVIGVVPYMGLNFAVYETLKHWLLIHYGACARGWRYGWDRHQVVRP